MFYMVLILYLWTITYISPPILLYIISISLSLSSSSSPPFSLGFFFKFLMMNVWVHFLVYILGRWWKEDPKNPLGPLFLSFSREGPRGGEANPKDKTDSSSPSCSNGWSRSPKKLKVSQKTEVSLQNSRNHPFCYTMLISQVLIINSYKMNETLRFAGLDPI